MKRFLFFLSIVCMAGMSCTKEKTDYEAEIDTIVPEHLEFMEAATVRSGGYDLRIEALNGTFYKGYNEIRVQVTSSQTKENVGAAAALTLLPVNSPTHGDPTSCPHRHELIYQPEGKYFSGYAVFTSESGTSGVWDLSLKITIGGQSHSVKQRIAVQPQPNKNLNITTFTGKDGIQYVIALVAPQKPKVAENALVAGIYRLHQPTGTPAGNVADPAQFSYTEVSGYTLLLDPRMPEPSMGNHSSPNNKDLTQQEDGLYHGVVNYTMTGNWTLNFILLNQHGQILKGTVVPDDFTPGVHGAKSELFIDILF